MEVLKDESSEGLESTDKQLLPSTKLSALNLRQQKRQDIQIWRKRKEEEQKANQETAVQLEKRNSKEAIEQKRTAFCMKQQRQKEVQRKRLLVFQLEHLATMHCSQRIICRFGWLPWLRLMEILREKFQIAQAHDTVQILRSALKYWYREIMGTKKECKKNSIASANEFQTKWRLHTYWNLWGRLAKRGDDLYASSLLERTLESFQQVIKKCKALERIWDERNCIWRYMHTWCEWQKFVRDNQSLRFFLYLSTDEIAMLNARRSMLSRFMRAWKEGLGMLRYGKERSHYKQQVGWRIHSWFDTCYQERLSDWKLHLEEEYETRKFWH